MTLRILYRGALDSCNYACGYCPFAKKPASRETLATDLTALERFVGHIATTCDRTYGILFTPWGEALAHRGYQRACAALSQVDHVERVAIQTNLSARAAWLRDARAERVGIWATCHPGQVKRETSVSRAMEYAAAGASLSVGIVGLPEHLEEARALRDELPAAIYVWVNAAKSSHMLDDAQHQAFEAIDPLFDFNTHYHPSLGRACEAGQHVISVDGHGAARRCHFVPEPIGNLYDGTAYGALRPRLCPNTTCGCHIGYVHMPELGLGSVFGSGILERVPRRLPVLPDAVLPDAVLPDAVLPDVVLPDAVLPDAVLPDVLMSADMTSEGA